MNKHITEKDIIEPLIASIDRYTEFGFKLEKTLCDFELSRTRYFNFKTRIASQDFDFSRKKSNKKASHSITQEEQEKIIKYALNNTNYFHRELAYRMIDENIVCVSPSTCYRVLKQHDLIKSNKSQARSWQCLYKNKASRPDELWQTDITYIRYRGKDLYLLIFIDVYSRFITFFKLLTSMDSKTVSDCFENFIEKNHNFFKRKPVLQSDNGSCYIGGEFKSLISRKKYEHVRIHPGTPTENAIVERVNRTVKESLYECEEPDNFEHLEKLIDQVVDYYNYKRYHKSLNYVTPHTFYRGKPEIIFEERNRKIALAKIERKMMNSLN